MGGCKTMISVASEELGPAKEAVVELAARVRDDIGHLQGSEEAQG